MSSLRISVYTLDNGTVVANVFIRSPTQKHDESRSALDAQEPTIPPIYAPSLRCGAGTAPAALEDTPTLATAANDASVSKPPHPHPLAQTHLLSTGPPASSSRSQATRIRSTTNAATPTWTERQMIVNRRGDANTIANAAVRGKGIRAGKVLHDAEDARAQGPAGAHAKGSARRGDVSSE
ncbi:hypothetical protein OH76DRAFT_1486586 [Lentinus brumalis]|uniref:Uncharacterized protein n=1 Tax=Lentinus brumalis TaxID=2498619 RepID=A0A371CXW1_9APHY|nr:hypothetical protein OH76DRAFT_1486586 [Polyporus brumalis]